MMLINCHVTNFFHLPKKPHEYNITRFFKKKWVNYCVGAGATSSVGTTSSAGVGSTSPVATTSSAGVGSTSPVATTSSVGAGAVFSIIGHLSLRIIHPPSPIHPFSHRLPPSDLMPVWTPKTNIAHKIITHKRILPTDARRAPPLQHFFPSQQALLQQSCDSVIILKKNKMQKPF